MEHTSELTVPSLFFANQSIKNTRQDISECRELMHAFQDQSNSRLTHRVG
jgi:hypothetical protein